MIPFWKIRRELLRLVYGPFHWSAEMVRKLYVRRYYDHVLARQIKRRAGALTIGSEIGIYLIFPSHGVLPSHLRVLREMKSAGISPYVVSNLPLSEADAAKIAPLAVGTLERPNVGYDFGGYRDGILNIKEQLPDLNRLWLLNDSTWMIPQDTSWFDDARDLDVDFAAATSNFAMPRFDPDRFREIKWSFSFMHRNFHYASYALGIGKPILQDPGFFRYWQKMEIRNHKSLVVRQGEIGLSQWILAQGYSHGATFEVDKLDAELDLLDSKEINTIASELVIPESPRLEAQRALALQSDPLTAAGRADRIALILTAVSRQASGYVLPGYSLRRCGFQFLKKSPLTLSPQSAEVMHMLINRIEGEVGVEICDEAQVIVNSQAR